MEQVGGERGEEGMEERQSESEKNQEIKRERTARKM